MSSNRIKGLLTILAENDLAIEYAGPNLDAEQKDTIDTIHKEFSKLVANGTHQSNYDIDPVIEKQLFNKVTASFIYESNGTTWENNDKNKSTAGKEYLSLFKSKPETQAPKPEAPSRTPPAPPKPNK